MIGLPLIGGIVDCDDHRPGLVSRRCLCLCGVVLAILGLGLALISFAFSLPAPPRSSSFVTAALRPAVRLDMAPLLAVEAFDVLPLGGLLFVSFCGSKGLFLRFHLLPEDSFLVLACGSADGSDGGHVLVIDVT